MGRASVKENKTVYQLSREACGMTRAEASEAMRFITDSRSRRSCWRCSTRSTTWKKTGTV